jgi:hypothetical protein
MPQKATSKKAKSQKPTSTDDSFEAVARRLECDEDRGRFEEKLGNIVKTKPANKVRKR